MKLYNTLTKKVEEFIPNNGNDVNLYTCGPTVYNYAHIGNLRTYITEDILEKSLIYLGYNVKRCMNITDVGHLVGDGDVGEDKMAVASKRENKSSYEIADYYTECFKKDCEKLNINWPEIVSKATDNIDEYIKIITKLINDGYAYLSDGNVYFDTTKFSKYYELSGRNTEDLLVAVREDINEDDAKKNPFDFGLWFTNSKFSNQELQWDSPWGRGYPGWHIECSGISLKYLGEYLDIHCGGIDAVFPHHTNEIAQSESYLGHKWCNYWLHSEFLNDATGKMSKSKGEFLTVSLLEEKGYNPLAYRFLCLQSHYRKVLVFTYEALEQATNTYNKIKNKIQALNNDGEVDKVEYDKFINQFKNALENDLNTSLMLTSLYDVLKSETNDITKIEIIKSFDKVLSLDLLKNETKEIDEELKKYIELKIEERKLAKINKNFELADNIRKELEEKNILIKDTREGTIYEVK
ncbi:MAG: cysteine--tRNA ligase [Firmicutes bacterium]|nr:cysteine--tRNA ligase [Bacillota bacterium]